MEDHAVQSRSYLLRADIHLPSAAHVAISQQLAVLVLAKTINDMIAGHSAPNAVTFVLRHLCEEFLSSTLVHQGTAGGEALQIGAARDKQTAADTAAMSGGASTGAATFAFIQARHHLLPP